MTILERYQANIAVVLDAIAPRGGILGRLIRYPLGLVEADGTAAPSVGGKLLRPSLVLLVCEALGGETERALPLAAAVELVHTFSLVHDDLVDGDRLRRGRPAAWVALGESQALHAGDGLLALAFRTAAGAELPGKAVARAVEALALATLAMVEGQALDLELEGQRVGTEAYLRMAQGKTGALLGCALALGAVAAGREDLAPAHRRVGETLGLAFQIRDDWLGLWGDPAVLGKGVGGDLARGKRSYPIAWALERDPALNLFLRTASLSDVRRRLEELGADEAAEAETAALLAQVREEAVGLPWAPWAQAAFGELCDGLAARVR